MRFLGSILCLLATIGYGQETENLVPNGGFETFETCPDNISHKLKANDVLIPHWYTPTRGTPDYYNACSESWKAKTGENWIGIMEPSDGDGYVGLLIEDAVREYVQVKLKEPLKAGHVYALSCEVAHATKTTFTSNGISLLLTHNPLVNDDYVNLFARPSMGINNYDQTLLENGWSRYSTEYVATGGEQYLTVGNVHLHSKKQKHKFNYDHDYSYYFVDEVEVALVGSVADDCEEENGHYFRPCLDNLVLNGGFEFHDDCQQPITEPGQVSGQRISALWHTASGGSADIYQRCALNERVIGDERLLISYPETGRGMGGFVAYHERNDTLDEYAEYLQGRLKQPMEAGKTYQVSFSVRASDFSGYAVKNLGVRFSDKFQNHKNRQHIEDPAHIGYQGKYEITYFDGWVQITGTYQAQGGEQYLIVGAFGSAEAVGKDEFQEGGFTIQARDERYVLPYAYYYVDNVIVNEDSACLRPRFQHKKDMNLVFLLDASAAMKPYWEELQVELPTIGDYLRVDDHVSLVAVSSKNRELLRDQSVKNYGQLLGSLSGLKIKGTLKKFDYTFETATDYFLSGDNLLEDSDNHIIFVTHGGFKPQVGLARNLREMGIDFDVLVMGPDKTQEQPLTTFAEDAGGKMTRVPKGQLLSIVMSVLFGD